jgi:YD repeat-containing protein
MEKKQITRQFQYDPLNRLLSISVKDDYTRVYTYDSAGNRLSVTGAGKPMPIVPVTGTVPAEPGVQKTRPPLVHAGQHRCGNCGTPTPHGKKFCSSCGAPVGATMPIAPVSPALPQTPSVCPGCGSPVKSGIQYCGDCGRRL